MIRLYDRGFKPIVPPRKAPAGIPPAASPSAPTARRWRLATMMRRPLTSSTDIRWSPLPGPNVDALALGTWLAKSHGRRMAAPSLREGVIMKKGAVLFWHGPMRAGASGALCWPGDNTVRGLAALPDGGLLVAAQDPFLAVLEADGSPRWAHPSPKADFRDQDKRWRCRRTARLSISALNGGAVTAALRSARAQAQPRSARRSPDDQAEASRACHRSLENEVSPNPRWQANRARTTREVAELGRPPGRGPLRAWNRVVAARL